jgi:hypothetical protein
MPDTPEEKNTPAEESGTPELQGAQRIQGILSGESPTPEIPESTSSLEDSDDKPVVEVLDGEDADLLEVELDDTPDDDDTEKLTTHKVTLPGGEEVEVPLDEWKKGYSRHADYTRKTQAAAKRAKEIEAEFESARDARTQYADRLKKLDEMITEMMPPEPDWDTVREEQPEEYQRLYTDWQRAEKKRENLKAERERVAAEEQGEQRAAFAAYVTEQQGILHEALPVLKDSEKAGPYIARLVKYAESIGIKREQVEQEPNAGAILVLDKARRYDAIKARVASLKKPRRAPTISPGTPREKSTLLTLSKEDAANRAKLKETGSEQAAVGVIDRILTQGGS